ncbi:MAG TPA: hypothetical protein VGM87_09340 [Roseomonas sp.]|jgi:hypothetical protein
MIRLLILLVVLAAVVFGAPLLIERQSSACAAVGAQAAGDVLQPPGTIADAAGRAAARITYPDLPAAVGCTLLYWRAKFGDRP